MEYFKIVISENMPLQKGIAMTEQENEGEVYCPLFKFFEQFHSIF